MKKTSHKSQAIPRNEYPRPQFKRKDWLCLNGAWEFEIDSGDSGLERGLHDRALKSRITVPFCPECELSGIGNTDFLDAVWYRRTVVLPKAWKGRRVLLHFQAVDHDTTVWVNGAEVGRHRGGWCGFTCDLKGVAEPGQTATIVVRARDLKAMSGKAGGKQSNHRYDNAFCHYNRTTGIWQTVWLEPVPDTYLLRPRITPDTANSCFRLEQPIHGNRAGMQLRATLRDGRRVMASRSIPANGDFTPQLDLAIPGKHRRLWSPDDPHLYDIEIELLDKRGKVVDTAASYAGLRSVTIEGKKILINGVSIFQRLVLDQGFYPDGLLTAPSDGALLRDIQLSMAAGFNGARLHQKVFEERFLYHADRLGYLCWGEFGDWGIDRENPGATYITQWLEVLQRDYSHPSIVGWCALNETSKPIEDRIQGLDDLTLGMFLAAKAQDATRPVLDASGYSHRVPETDVYDSHDYSGNPTAFQEQQAGLQKDKPYVNAGQDWRGQPIAWSVPYRGQPYFVSEFGGTWWNLPAKTKAKPTDSWGYGEKPKTLEEFHARFENLCRVLLDNPHMFGYCYTQLTDVFQEQNGIYLFNRNAKFDTKRIRAAQQRPAAIEKNKRG